MSLIESHNASIRPKLDAIDKLRNIGLKDEGISLPTIVVVGDQSSGKSSVLESLAGITLPKGTGIVTRVPLILRLKRCLKAADECIRISYEADRETAQKAYSEKLASESFIPDRIMDLTCVLAGNSKGVVNKPLTLLICKQDLPDLTLVDLPGITRVPIHGQPDNICEIIKDMIDEYIKPEESVILNVMSAEVDFSTCESIRMSHKVDPEGKRTLAVVTKIDRAPDGVYEKVISSAVRVGLGYICVRNKCGNDLHHRASRAQEKKLFEEHAQLSQLPEMMRGIKSLAERLVDIQAKRIIAGVPTLKEKLKKLLREKQEELMRTPKGVDSAEEASLLFMSVLQERRELLSSLMCGDYERFSDDESMHFAVRLHEFFVEFDTSLRKESGGFLTKSYRKRCEAALKEAMGTSLPNILAGSAVKLLVREEVEKIRPLCEELVLNCLDYAEEVSEKCISAVCGNFNELARIFSQVNDSLFAEARDECGVFLSRVLKKESTIIFTNNHYYMDTVNNIRQKLQAKKDEAVGTPYHRQGQGLTTVQCAAPLFSSNLKSADDGEEMDLSCLVDNASQATTDLQVNLFSYWKVIHKRVADFLPMEIKRILEDFLVDKLEKKVLEATQGESLVEAMSLEPQTQLHYKCLQESIVKLKEGLRTLARLQ